MESPIRRGWGATRPRERILAGLALLVALVALAYACAGPLVASNPVDLRAFYCAGIVANAGADPYRIEPLRRCEHGLGRAAGMPLVPGVVVPAPLPAYALVPFRVLATLPFRVAIALVTFATILAVGVTVVALRDLTGLPLVALGALFVLSDLWLSILLGQIAAFAIAFGTLGATALARGWYGTAGVLAVASTVEPHLGVPMLAGCCVLVPQTRRSAALAVAVLGIVSLATQSPAMLREYLGPVLQTHLQSELASPIQFGLAHVLWMSGLPTHLALRLCEPAYVLAVAAGIIAAARLRRGPWRGARALCMLAPLATGVAFAPFSHLTQACAALPAILVLASATGTRGYAAIACAALGVPWIILVENATPWPAAAIVAIAVALAAATIARLSRRMTFALVLGSTIVAVYVTRARFAAPFDPIALGHRLSGLDPSAIAERNWQIFASATAATATPGTVWAQIPTWVGLLCCCLVLATTAWRTRPPAQSAAKQAS